jgi:hypothetical protein
MLSELASFPIILSTAVNLFSACLSRMQPVQACCRTCIFGKETPRIGGISSDMHVWKAALRIDPLVAGRRALCAGVVVVAKRVACTRATQVEPLYPECDHGISTHGLQSRP